MKNKAEMMRALRRRRKEQGLVEIRGVWVKHELMDYIKGVALDLSSIMSDKSKNYLQGELKSND